MLENKLEYINKWFDVIKNYVVFEHEDNDINEIEISFNKENNIKYAKIIFKDRSLFKYIDEEDGSIKVLDEKHPYIPGHVNFLRKSGLWI